jgi:hypothetical protein
MTPEEAIDEILRRDEIIESYKALLTASQAENARLRVADSKRTDEVLERHKRDLAAILLFMDSIYDDAPSYPYDNGGTSDGWHMACRKIESYIEGVQEARAFAQPNQVKE